jgi:hypothetical protein
MNMQIFIRIIVVAVILLMIKAFFLDDYLAQKAAEDNSTAEINPGTEVMSAPPVEGMSPPPVIKEENIQNIRGLKGEKQPKESKRPVDSMHDKEKMPVDKLGDSIADKLNL